MTFLRTTSSATIPFSGSAERAIDPVRAAAERLGWELTDERNGQLTISEDATRLHCHCHPIEATVRFEPDAEAIEIDATVPGRGPVSRKHVEEATGILARAVVAAIRSSEASPIPR